MIKNNCKFKVNFTYTFHTADYFTTTVDEVSTPKNQKKKHIVNIYTCTRQH